MKVVMISEDQRRILLENGCLLISGNGAFDIGKLNIEGEKKMTHNIKIKKTFVEPILKGEKTFEIRKNDRGYQKGDRIRFTVVDASLFESQKEQAYRQAIEQRVYEITYVLNGWGLEPDFVAFGIREVGY